MPTNELPDSAPGTYVPYHPEPYYSPEPLPVEPPLELSDRTHDLVADAAYQIGRVDGISSTVDFAAVLYRRSRPSASGLDPEGEGRTLR